MSAGGRTLHRHRNMCGRVSASPSWRPSSTRCSGRPWRLARSQAADFPPWVLLGVKIDQCPHSAEGDMRALNEGSGFGPVADIERRSAALSWRIAQEVVAATQISEYRWDWR